MSSHAKDAKWFGKNIMTELTQDEINTLSGLELDAAIAEAEGWSGEGYGGWRHPNGGRSVGPPLYHTAAELGRLLVELEHDSSKDVRLRDKGDCWEVCCYIRDEHVRFQGETIEFAVCRAYLWLKQNEGEG